MFFEGDIIGDEFKNWLDEPEGFSFWFWDMEDMEMYLVEKPTTVLCAMVGSLK